MILIWCWSFWWVKNTKWSLVYAKIVNRRLIYNDRPTKKKCSFVRGPLWLLPITTHIIYVYFFIWERESKQKMTNRNSFKSARIRLCDQIMMIIIMFVSLVIELSKILLRSHQKHITIKIIDLFVATEKCSKRRQKRKILSHSTNLCIYCYR